MRTHTAYRFRGFAPASRTAFRKFRLLAPLLLMMMGCSRSGIDLAGPNAQKAGSEEGKTADETSRPLPSPVPLPPSPPDPLRVANSRQPPNSAPCPPRFEFKIDPETPLRDLLPIPPRNMRVAALDRSDNLRQVPEVQFEAPDGSCKTEGMKHIAHQIAKINFLNAKKTDGFVEALRSERPDLAGLPFAMGDACRSKGERSKQFALAVAMVRLALQPVAPPPPTPAEETPPASAAPVPLATTSGPMSRDDSIPIVNDGGIFFGNFGPPPPERFWDQYQTRCTKEDKAWSQIGGEQSETITLTRIAALAQILMPMPQMHLGFVRYLATVSHVEATRALARLVIFSDDEAVHKAAIEALKNRREPEGTAILVNGLHYPWPDVARRAAEAIAKLERNDLLPQLIDVLEKDDPRAPVTEKVKGKSVPVVHELVRVNHNRSCLLCHAPSGTMQATVGTLTAGVPVPGQPLNPSMNGYNDSPSDIVVRVDVTYLRQDFSKLLAVADTDPWPEMQRFDFLVRTRVLSDDEAAAYCEKLKPHEPGEFSPYQRAALAALRELTGRDTEPTPQAWRRLLKLPAETQRKPKAS